MSDVSDDLYKSVFVVSLAFVIYSVAANGQCQEPMPMPCLSPCLEVPMVNVDMFCIFLLFTRSLCFSIVFICVCVPYNYSASFFITLTCFFRVYLLI